MTILSNAPPPLVRAPLAIGVLLLLTTCSPGEPLPSPDVTVYRGATLIDGTGSPPIRNALLVVEDDLITGVGAATDLAVPEGAQVVDLTGQFLIPGLIDTHVHYMESGRLQDLRYYRMEVPGLDMSKAGEERWFMDRLPITLSRTLCAGVTTAVSLGGPRGLEYGARSLSESQEMSPRVFVAGGPLGEGDPALLFPDFAGDACTYQAVSEDGARASVTEFLGDGADLVKLGYLGASMAGAGGPSFVEYVPVLAAAIEESHRMGLPVVTHLMQLEEFRHALATGLQTDAFAHIPFDQPVDEEFAAALRQSGIPVTGTISVFEPMVEVLNGTRELLPVEARCGDPEIIATWEIEPEAVPQAARFMAAGVELSGPILAGNIKTLHDAGVEMSVGSDAAHVGQLHGASFHYELLALQEAGIAPDDLLVSATRNGARLLGREDELGTLEEGKLADFVVLSADPTEDIRNAQQIVGVARGGRYFKQDRILAFDPDA